jgi:preprotein translocase subunit SecG
MTLVVVVHLMIVVAMIGVVLLQKSEGGGLGIGSTGGFLTSRGTANVLTRATAILAALFFITSLGLSILAGMGRKPQSIINTTTPASQQQPGAPPAPLGEGGGVLDALRKQGQQQAPGAPASAPEAPAPTGPQVPQSR